MVLDTIHILSTNIEYFLFMQPFYLVLWTFERLEKKIPLEFVVKKKLYYPRKTTTLPNKHYPGFYATCCKNIHEQNVFVSTLHCKQQDGPSFLVNITPPKLIDELLNKSWLKNSGPILVQVGVSIMQCSSIDTALERKMSNKEQDVLIN